MVLTSSLPPDQAPLERLHDVSQKYGLQDDDDRRGEQQVGLELTAVIQQERTHAYGQHEELHDHHAREGAPQPYAQAREDGGYGARDEDAGPHLPLRSAEASGHLYQAAVHL